MIFDFTLEQLQDVEVFCRNNPSSKSGRISTLEEILDIFGGHISLEIHVQGPEPEAAEIIGATLKQFSHLWDQFELTSYEPTMLLAFQEVCPGLARDLLFPRSESWMTLDIVRHQAIHLSRLAKARAVHLHPSQLSEKVVNTLHNQGIEIHAWDVNDEQFLLFEIKCLKAHGCPTSRPYLSAVQNFRKLENVWQNNQLFIGEPLGF